MKEAIALIEAEAHQGFMKKNRNFTFTAGFDRGMNDEPPFDNQDPVWRLLAQAPRPEPDAWFTVRTLARCRHVGLGSDYRAFFSSHLWRWALGGGLSLGLALMVFTNQVDLPSTAPSNQKNVQEAFEIMASLGTDSEAPASPGQDSSL